MDATATYREAELMRPYMQQAPAQAQLEKPLHVPQPGDCPKHAYRLASSCPECRREADLERRAKELVNRRLSERSRRIEDGLRAYDSAIKRDQVAIEQRYAAHYLESIQLKTWNEAAEPYTDRVGAEVDAEMLREALAELQSAEASA